MKNLLKNLGLILLSVLLVTTGAKAVSTFVVQQGGTGVNTITGCIRGNGTAPFTGNGSACGTLTAANNGTSLSGSTVQLGGTLIHDTSIDIDAYALVLNKGAQEILRINPNSSFDAFLYVSSAATFADSLSLGDYGFPEATLSFEAGGGVHDIQVSASNATADFHLYLPNIAAYAGGDAAKTLVSRVNGQDADTAGRVVITGANITGVLTTADNGLTVTAKNVQLGGVLIKDTTISTGGFTLSLAGDTNGLVRWNGDKLSILDSDLVGNAGFLHVGSDFGYIELAGGDYTDLVGETGIISSTDLVVQSPQDILLYNQNADSGYTARVFLHAPDDGVEGLRISYEANDGENYISMDAQGLTISPGDNMYFRNIPVEAADVTYLYGTNTNATTQTFEGVKIGPTLTVSVAGQLDVSASGATIPINNLLAATGTNSIENGDYGQVWSWSTLSNAPALTISSNSTTAASGGQVGIRSVLAGVNANSSQETISGRFQNIHSGTGSTNIGISGEVSGGTTNTAGKFSASGGTTNYAIQTTNGNVSITNANTTAVTTLSALALGVNSLTTGTGAYFASSTLTSGKLIDVAVTGTAGADGQTGINVSLSGALGVTSQSTYGIQVSNTHTGASTTNYGGKFTASGAGINYALSGVNTAINSANERAGYFSGNLTVASSNTVASGTASAFDIQGNATTTGTIFNVGNSSITSGHVMDLGITANTVGLTGQTVLNIALNGANAASSQTTYGMRVSNTHTGTGAVNYAATFKGLVGLEGTSSGIVSITPAAAAGTWTFQLPTTGGTNNYVLTTNGSGVSTWTDVNSIVSPFGLTSGSGTTVNGSTLDLGGSLTTNAFIDGNNNYDFYIANIKNYFAIGNGRYDPSPGSDHGFIGYDGSVGEGFAWIGDFSIQHNGTMLSVDDDANVIFLGSRGGTSATEIRFFDSATSGASNGYVWTLQDNTTGRGAWVAASGGSGLTIGTTAITSGTANGAVLFDSGPGTLQENSTFNFIGTRLSVPDAGLGSPNVTGTALSSSFFVAANSLTTGTAAYMTSASSTSGNILQIISTGTVKAAGNEALDIAVSGANGTNAITATGARISVTNTNATSGTNVGLEVTASGATTANWAVDAIGNFRLTSANTTQVTTGSSFVLAAAGLTTGTGIYSRPNALTTGTILNLVTTSSTLDTNATIGLFQMIGSTSGASKTTYGVRIENTATGTTNTNIGLDIQTSGGSTDNIAINATGAIRQTSANTTGVTTSAAHTLNVNSLTTGTGMYFASSTLSSGKMIDLAITGTAGLTNQTGLNLSLSGANGTGAQTTYGAIFSNTHTGTSVNVGAEFIASGGSTNTAIRVASGNGRVAIGQLNANASLDVVGTAILDAIQTSSVGGNSSFFASSATGASGTTTATLLFAGATTVDFRNAMNGTTSTTMGVGRSYATQIIGASAITEAGSGTQALISSLVLKAPTITAGAAAVTNTATEYIEGAPSAAGATNYSMWVDDGLVRMDAGILLGAGTASAGTAPIKLTSGTNLTTAEAGALEYNGINLFFTPTGTIRKTIPTVVTTRSDAQTAAVATVATQTVGANDATYIVSANVLVTTSTVHNFTATVAYTDEGNTARTVTLQFSTLAGAFVTAMTNAQGAVPYEGVPLHIRAKSGSTITIATTGTFTTVTYNVEGSISQVN